MAGQHEVKPHTREILAEDRYLLFPVRNGAPKQQMRVLAQGLFDRYFDIELAQGAADFWAFMDIACAKGRKITLSAQSPSADAAMLGAIDQSGTIRGSEDLYRERLRPQFHFSSRRGWLNDPNGLVYYKDEWHLFYQHIPYGIDSGNKHWGHAVSRDLVHWEELPIAIYPDSLGDAWSGSAVVDWNNTAGFEQGPEKTIVCCYTAAGGYNANSMNQPLSQCLVFSNDRGRTWQKYAGNPVLPHIIGLNRDPKVIWHEPEKKWVMALFMDGSEYALLASPDLKKWEQLSTLTIPDCLECPEFFEIPVDGDRSNTRWVFYTGNNNYVVGRFDGRTFTPQSGPRDLHYGNCYNASQTFNDVPPADGRRIAIGWGWGVRPGISFNQMMAFPVELTLRTAGDRMRLHVNPAREIEMIHGQKHEWNNVALDSTRVPLKGVKGELFDISVRIAVGEAKETGILIRGLPVAFRAEQGQLVCRDKSAPIELVNGKFDLRLLVDCSSVEIFANNGWPYMPMTMEPADDDKSLAVFAEGGEALVENVSVTELDSIWPGPAHK